MSSRDRAVAPARAPSPHDLAGLIASFVRSHPSEASLRADVGTLHDYLRFRGFAEPDRAAVETAALGHWRQLERYAEKARREAELFTPGRPPRPPHYRHGAAFCPRCALHKDYHKECGHCGHLELTV